MWGWAVAGVGPDPGVVDVDAAPVGVADVERVYERRVGEVVECGVCERRFLFSHACEVVDTPLHD